MLNPVVSGLIWMVASLSVVAGLLALATSGSILVRQRTAAMRLATLLASGRARADALERLMQWFERFGRKIARGGEGSREIRDILSRAGYFRPAGVFIFIGLRFGMAVGVGFAVLFWRGHSSGFGIVNTLIAVAFALLFYRYALIALKYQGERRARRIQRELPAVLDLVLMVLDSGVSIDQCLHYVADVAKRSAPTTAAVLGKHVADVESGVPYDVALDRLGQRLAVDEGVDFANLLKQALFQGGELGSSLRRFSSEVADKRLSRAREEGGRRATYLTVVMVFFFVPVLLVILVGPAVVRVTDTVQAAAHRTLHK
jgi:tight adherence protein C